MTKAVVLDLLFVARPACARFLRELEAEDVVRSTVLRGRMTGAGAWMRIRLCGEAEAVDALQRRWTGYTLGSGAA